MKLLNFVIGSQNIDLEWPDGGYADLHNDYDFSQLTYVPAEARLTLSWRKSSGKWAKYAPSQALHLVFEKVSYLQVKARDPAYPISEDECLRDICFSPLDERADFDHVWESHTLPPARDLQLVFQSEWGIKVSADTVLLELES
ncbi:hypothetical protein [Hymenobacter sp.]|jgi:hypothetical protein|uniref:hypothetical protein n=1 Tax=Hymenobacter sp. TaxID=1898978 RepID=UPI002ED8C69F